MKECAACLHLHREALDAAFADGAPYKYLKERFGVSLGSLKRHRKASTADYAPPVLLPDRNFSTVSKTSPKFCNKGVL